MWAWDTNWPVLVANDCLWQTCIVSLPPEIVGPYVLHGERTMGAVPCPECSTEVYVPSMPRWMRDRLLDGLPVSHAEQTKPVRPQGFMPPVSR